MKAYLTVFFMVLIGYQLGNALYNVTQGRWDWVSFDLACAAVVVGSLFVSRRALTSVEQLDAERDATIGHYQVMLDDMRRSGNEDGERYAITMLAIWSKRPVPLAPGDQEDGGLSS